MWRSGDKVRVFDGLGNVVVERAEVSLGTINGIVYLREKMPNGNMLHYGVPTSAVEPVKIDTRPTLGEVVGALREVFLGGQNGNGR